MASELIGQSVEALETPVLLIDLDALEHNVAVIANHYRDKAIRLRPHGKNHKSPWILAMQLAAGGTVGGVCAAKVSEAEAFVAEARGTVANVLVANQVVDERKIERLARLAERADVMVAVDDPAQVDRLVLGAAAVGTTLGVVIEVDIMMGRGGVRTVRQALALADCIAAAPGLRLRGVMSHQVPLARSPNRAERFAEGRRFIGRVIEVKDALEAAGFAVEVVSTGETWSYDVAATVPAVTEIEGGSYIVMEVPYAYMDEFAFAARVMGRIVSRPDTRTAIGDVHIEAIGAPNGPPTLDGLPGVAATAIDHHGVVLTSDRDFDLGVGEPFFLLTHQQDVTMNRWDRYIGVRRGVVEQVIDATARGCVH
jgi:3-hydroxy-D-aspartate aldolase